MNKNSELLHDKTKSGFPEENTNKENKNSATLKVSDVAQILGVSPQTVRLLLQMGAVEWGLAYKLPHSRHFSYIIFSNKFYEALGITGGDGNC